MDVKTYQVATNNSKGGSGGAPADHTHDYTDITGLSYKYLEYKEDFIDLSNIENTTGIVLNGYLTMKDLEKFKTFGFSTDECIDYSTSENIAKYGDNIGIIPTSVSGYYTSKLIDVPSIDKVSLSAIDINKNINGFEVSEFIQNNTWVVSSIDELGRTWMFYCDVLEQSHNSAFKINMKAAIYDRNNNIIGSFTHAFGYTGGIPIFGSSISFDSDNNAVLGVNIKGCYPNHYTNPFSSHYYRLDNSTFTFPPSNYAEKLPITIKTNDAATLFFKYSTAGFISEVGNLNSVRAIQATLEGACSSTIPKCIFNNGIISLISGFRTKGQSGYSSTNDYFRENVLIKMVENGVEYENSKIRVGVVPVGAYTGNYIAYSFCYKDRTVLLYSAWHTLYYFGELNYTIIKKDTDGTIVNESKNITSAICSKLPKNCSGLLNGMHLDESTGKLYIFQGDKDSATVYFSELVYDEMTDTFIRGNIGAKPIILTKRAYTYPLGDIHPGITPKFLIKDGIIHILFVGYMYDDISFSLRYVGVDLEGNIVNPDIEVYAKDGEGVHNFDILEKNDGTLEFIFGAGSFDGYRTTTSPKGGIHKAVFSTVTTEISYQVFSREDSNWYNVEKGAVIDFINPTDKVKVRANMSTPSLTESPEISSITIDCIDALTPSNQYFISKKIEFNNLYSGEILFNYEAEVTDGSVSFYMSNDGGINWIPINNGDVFSYDPITCYDLRIKGELNRGTDSTIPPKILNYKLTKKEPYVSFV